MNKAKNEIFIKILKDNNLSITKPRLIVFEGLVNSASPKSMKELYNLVGNNIDRVSVYRVVALFERLGIINKIAIGFKYKIELSEVFTEHHHHISCIKCGKIIAITDDGPIENYVKDIAKKYKFSGIKHNFELNGYCPKCQP